jgi:hypothetical protein
MKRESAWYGDDEFSQPPAMASCVLLLDVRSDSERSRQQDRIADELFGEDESLMLDGPVTQVRTSVCAVVSA